MSSQQARRQLEPEEIALDQRSWRQHRFSSSKAKQEINFTEGLKEADEVAELEKEEDGVQVEDLRAYFKDVKE